MEKLIEGYRSFRTNYFPHNRAMFNQLAQGQAPKAMVICCCDSRIDANLILGAKPGEIFTLRNVANLVPPYSPDNDYHGTSAAIEFAVRGLHVNYIVVMGHSQCGGVRALLGEHEGDFIGPWMSIAEAARRRAVAVGGDKPGPELQHLCELETIKTSLHNLRTFPWIRERLNDASLSLHGWHFDIETGQIIGLDEETGDFRPL